MNFNNKRFSWKVARKNIKKAMKSKDWLILLPVVCVTMAVWRNKVKYISPRSIVKYQENEWFTPCYRGLAGVWEPKNFIKGEIGIDCKKLERIVVKNV